MLIESEESFEFELDEEDELDQEAEEPKVPRVVLVGREKKALDEALVRFSCCGRCSLFLAAYRLRHDDLVLQTAVQTISGGWLTLPTDLSIRGLINKCYGCQVDVEAYHFESSCPECHEPFVYAETDADQPSTLRMKM